MGTFGKWELLDRWHVGTWLVSWMRLNSVEMTVKAWPVC